MTINKVILGVRRKAEKKSKYLLAFIATKLPLPFFWTREGPRLKFNPLSHKHFTFALKRKIRPPEAFRDSKM